MDRLLRPLANSLWILLSLPEALAFHRATRNVAAIQQRILMDLLRGNADTEFGRRHGFARIHTVTEYQQRVPLCTYEDLCPWLDQVSAGEPRMLTSGPVRLLEPTSGSTAATKYIPYTDALKAEFQRGIAPWVVRTFLRHPGLFQGQAYWSVTPVIQHNRRSPGGIPIGFEEESDYFGSIERYLIRAVMAVPPQVKLISDLESFRYVTLLFLLRSRSLALISIWNPTFLTLLVERLMQWEAPLTADIAQGTISAPGPLDTDLRAQLARANQPDLIRAADLRSILTNAAHVDRGELHRQIWPHLRLISCWADANAARYAEQVIRLFPQARLQPKGLLATEGFVSFPLEGYSGSALSVCSHFFEFLPANSGIESQTRLAHELVVGEQYKVVFSTNGGLYRYQLGDVVEVVGHYHECPLLRFLGREHYVSDWFGEKLHERHVQRALDEVLASYALEPGFAMLACEDRLSPPAYVLYIQAEDTEGSLLKTLGDALEQKLQQNYHYAYCRSLGQLDTLRVFQIHGDALDAYTRASVVRGQRAGDIKPVTLHCQSGWMEVFSGKLLKRTRNW